MDELAYAAKMDALLAFIRQAQQPVTGEVTLGLYKGNLLVQSRTSPNSLYDRAIATMDSASTTARLRTVEGRFSGRLQKP